MEIIDLKALVKIIKNTKWWFISTFIIVFIIGMLLNFFAFPNLRYYSKSHIIVSFKNAVFQDLVSINFKEENVNLWLIVSPTYWNQSVNNWLTATTKSLSSDEFLGELSGKLNNRFTISELKKSIKFDRDIEINSLNITVSRNNKSEAYEINKKLLEFFSQKKEAEFQEAYLKLLLKVDDRLRALEKNMDLISEEASLKVTDYYKNNLNNPDSNNQKVEEIFTSTALPDDLAAKINEYEIEYKMLSDVKNNLIENKDFYIKRIFYIIEPDVYSNLDFFRNIILSIFAGFLLACATSLFVNIYNNRSKK